ncbi:hypothetical protein M8C21_006682, partial [Ambrosia artemisiifolia]
ITMISSLMRFGRRQLHTVVHREIIKPSSPTPSHLKTYNLSLFDQIVTNTFTPIVAFYPTTNVYGSFHDKTPDLKKSLSETLTKYYPFAGRHPKIAPTYVDCNDDGVEFLEASIDSTLSDFLQKSQHEDFNRLCPNGLVWYESIYNKHDPSDNVAPLAIQVNHFECGGIALAASLSHKVADGSSLISFLNDWGKVTRYMSNDSKHECSIEPYFNSFQHTNLKFSGFSIAGSNDCITRSFIFPNKKINDLKHKVTTMTKESRQPVTDPTRVDVLTWLLYKCAVASTNKNDSHSFKPTGISIPTNIRRKMIKPLPENSIGNILAVIGVQTKNESEMKPEFFINEVKKRKMELRGLKDLETVFDHFWKKVLDADVQKQQRILDVSYVCTSMCRSAAYEIDF